MLFNTQTQKNLARNEVNPESESTSQIILIAGQPYRTEVRTGLFLPKFMDTYTPKETHRLFPRHGMKRRYAKKVSEHKPDISTVQTIQKDPSNR